MKKDIREIKNYIKNIVGYDLLSTEYQNNQTPLLILCNKGHRYISCWNRISSHGARCPECDRLTRIDKQTHNYEFVKNIIEDVDGYKLISKDYQKSILPLEIKCNKGHIFSMRFSNFYNGNQRCPVCFGNKKLCFDDVKNYIESTEGFKLLSNTYVNSKAKFEIQCPVGHVYKTNWNNFKNGSRCLMCSGKTKHSHNHISDIFNNEGYMLLEKYKNNCTKMKVMCDRKHVYETTSKMFMVGHRCPKCFANGQISRSEKKILQFVKNNYFGPVFENNRTIIKNPITNFYLELDIWMPELNKAIEYNGSWYHSSPEVIQRDSIKQQECKKLGINLLVIKDVNWKMESSKINNLVINFINEVKP